MSNTQKDVPGSGASQTSTEFSERLAPGPWLFVVLLLLIPAVLLMIMPISANSALPIALGAYVIISASLILMAPQIKVRDGKLYAGSATIDLSLLGDVQQLDTETLRRTIGTEADARAYLVVRGYIKRGVRIELLDDTDPTPYWVITTRKPNQLAQAIIAAKQ